MWIHILIALPLLILSMLGYLKIAAHFNIVDRPNKRSSHQNLVIRGGGVIFYLSSLFFELSSGFQYPYFFLGLTLITLISFLDDISSLPNSIRIAVHFVAIALLFYQLELLSSLWWIAALIFVISIGTVNAYNFMDGINGITGIYSIVLLGTIIFINQFLIGYISLNLPLVLLLGLIVFGYFNFRVKAKCFAGDVGSVSMAFIVIFLVIKLIFAAKDWTFMLFLAVYGVDSVLTIIYRLLRKENIFKAHRSHLYQHLANLKQIPHIQVALAYGIVQLAVNALIILNYQSGQLSSIQIGAVILVPLGISYILLKALYVPPDSVTRV